MPKGCIIDFTMSSGGSIPRIHQVQVVTPANEKSARFSLEAQNAFIQNAMSNSAAPVYATVGTDGKVSCVDINTRSRVLITKQNIPAKPVSAAVKPTAVKPMATDVSKKPATKPTTDPKKPATKPTAVKPSIPRFTNGRRD